MKRDRINLLNNPMDIQEKLDQNRVNERERARERAKKKVKGTTDNSKSFNTKHGRV